MKKFMLSVTVAILAASSVSFVPNKAAGQKAGIKRAVQPVAGRYIVLLEDDIVGREAAEPEVTAWGRYLSDRYGASVRDVYSSAVRGFVAEMTEKQAEQMNLDLAVRSVEEDGYISITADQSAAPWHLDRVDQRSLPMDARYGYTSQGANVHVYVIDTGIRVTHQDLGGRADAVYDNINDGQNGNDCSGHGTHVAGIIGGTTYGVAKQASLHAVRVLPCVGNGQISNLLAGINWVTANRIAPAVANISITAPGSSPALEAGLTNSIASGITYSLASGNNAQDACNFTPARTPTALTVGATAADDSKASYSNYGSCVDLLAPGNLITSLSNASDTGTRLMSGTSMAAPMVAGAAALYLSDHPAAGPAEVGDAIKAASTMNAVTGLDPASANRLLFSQVGVPIAGVRVKKVRQTAGGSSVVEFPYLTTNLADPRFTLTDNAMYFDPGVEVTNGQTVVSIREEPVQGWRLTSITCAETLNGVPTTGNSSVSIGDQLAVVRAESGEEITCTFTSEPAAPSAAGVTVSGRLTNADGNAVTGARVGLTDLDGQTVYALSGPFGYFVFEDVAAGQSYTLTAASRNLRFDPRMILVNEDLAELVLTGY